MGMILSFVVLLFVVLLGAFILVVSPYKSKLKRKEEAAAAAAAGLPDGSMGWPFIGETFSFLKPHKSNSTGRFLQQHCSR